MSLALIVDDSRTSSVILEKMLLRHNIEAVNVDSAEQALEYLKSERPSVIFMDHMMPGMDGFDAVKAIKSEPDLAAIPIVMHTSKTGEIYVGHARALGAADILTKPASDKALGEVLARLEQRSHLTIELPGVITEQVSELLLKPEVGTVEPLDNSDKPMAVTAGFEAVNFAEPLPSSPWPTVFAGLLFVALVWVLSLYLPGDKQRQELLARQQSLYNLISWAASQSADFDYGELPMSGRRLQLLEGLVAQLVAQNFKGELRLVGHVGAFCLSDTPSDSGGRLALLAPSDIPVSACAQVGMAPGQAVIASRQQSDAFRAFVNNSPMLKASQIRLNVEGLGVSAPAFAYPSGDNSLTAGDWNQVALQNNHVEFQIIPDKD